MLIMLSIHRPGGTVVFMPNNGAKDTKYNFAPSDTDPDGPHLAEVGNSRHAELFLAIPEYSVWPGGSAEAPVSSVAPAASIAPVVEPAIISEPVAEPAQESVQDETVSPDDDDLGLDGMTRPELMVLYQEELGQKPHPQIGIDTLRTRISEHRAEEAQAAG